MLIDILQRSATVNFVEKTWRNICYFSMFLSQWSLVVVGQLVKTCSVNFFMMLFLVDKIISPIISKTHPLLLVVVYMLLLSTEISSCMCSLTLKYPQPHKRDILALFCVFASGEDEYWWKYCDVVQGRYIAGKPMTSSIHRFSHRWMSRDLVGGFIYVFMWSYVGFCR
jgi:hypothetical protein